MVLLMKWSWLPSTFSPCCCWVAASQTTPTVAATKTAQASPPARICVDNKCQQCRPDHDDCGAGMSCNSGRCDPIPGYCAKNADCPSGMCEKNRCAACTLDKHCPGGTRCSAGKCQTDTRKPCKAQ